jgi:alkylation response protein AidB-like acyl-CoA dehydrogenase
MSVAISEEHRELERVARSFLTERGARNAARELLETGDELAPKWWDELVGLGWLGLHLPDRYGGSGFSLSELVIVLEEMGRQVAPGPFLPTVSASAIISLAGDEHQKDRWLRGLAEGTSNGAVGLGGNLRLDSGRLIGTADPVLGGAGADLLLLVADSDIVIVEASAARITVSENLDPTRRVANVVVDGVEIPDSQVIAGVAALAVAVARLLAAAEAVGGAHATLEMARDYAKVREQFGRVIGTFQAVKHHCANMLVAAELATSAVWDAARSTDAPREELIFSANAAAALALPAFLRNAELNIQLHGGIGYTWEHDAHLYLRRAGVLVVLYQPTEAAAEVTHLAAAGVRRRQGIDLPKEAEKIRAEVRSTVARLRTMSDAERRRELIDTGYIQPHWPRPYGRAASAVEQLVIEEEMADIPKPSYGIGTWIILTLIQHATDDQRERWIRPSLEQELVWCQLFSEPSAGSDAAGIRTRGTKVDGGWIVNGQKVWTSGAQHCNRGFATVRTDPDASKHQGVTMMVIDLMSAGVEVRPLRDITGSAAFNEVFLDDVFVPDDDVVGAVNQGWTVARSTLGNERVSIGSGMFSFGSEIDLVAHAAAAAQRLPGCERAVGALLAEGLAMSVLNLRSAQRAVAGGEPGPEGNVAKLLSAEHAQRIADLAVELIGPQAAILEGPLGVASRMLLSTRGLSIAGGTSEITRNQIAERILGLPRDPLLR